MVSIDRISSATVLGYRPAKRGPAEEMAVRLAHNVKPWRAGLLREPLLRDAHPLPTCVSGQAASATHFKKGRPGAAAHVLAGGGVGTGGVVTRRFAGRAATCIRMIQIKAESRSIDILPRLAGEAFDDQARRLRGSGPAGHAASLGEIADRRCADQSRPPFEQNPRLGGEAGAISGSCPARDCCRYCSNNPPTRAVYAGLRSFAKPQPCKTREQRKPAAQTSLPKPYRHVINLRLFKIRVVLPYVMSFNTISQKRFHIALIPLRSYGRFSVFAARKP